MLAMSLLLPPPPLGPNYKKIKLKNSMVVAHLRVTLFININAIYKPYQPKGYHMFFFHGGVKLKIFSHVVIEMFNYL
jgi:hypothetical protein